MATVSLSVGHDESGLGLLLEVRAASPRFFIRARPRRHSCEASSLDVRPPPPCPPIPMEDPTDELQETLAKVVDPVSVLKLTLEPVVPAPVVLNTSVLSPGGMAPLSLVLVGQVWSLTQYLIFRGKTILADIYKHYVLRRKWFSSDFSKCFYDWLRIAFCRRET